MDSGTNRVTFGQSQLGSQGRQSRTSSFKNQDLTNDNDNNQVQDDLSDDEPLPLPLLRSGSSVILPVRSLSPFRNVRPMVIEDSDSSRCSTPEYNPDLDKPLPDIEEEDEEEEEEADLGKDLFPMQFRKSLLKALNSFSEVQDKPGSFVRVGSNKSAPTLVAEKSVVETPKKTEVEVTPKKAEVEVTPKKTRKRVSKEPVVDTPSPKVTRKDLTPKRAAVVTRASASKLTNGPADTSPYYNLSQTKINIFKAAEEGNVEVVKQLLHYSGPNIKSGKRHQSLLHAAAANGQSDVVLYLLNLVSPNVINKDGQTPAHMAAMNGYTQILKIILADTEFDRDHKDNFKRTFRDLLVAPLFEAALFGNKGKLEALLDLGADPDYHAGRLVDGILSRELRVTTARQLAGAMHGERLLKVFAKERKDYVNTLKVTFTRTLKASSKKLTRMPSKTAQVVLM